MVRGRSTAGALAMTLLLAIGACSDDAGPAAGRYARGSAGNGGAVEPGGGDGGDDGGTDGGAGEPSGRADEAGAGGSDESAGGAGASGAAGNPVGSDADSGAGGDDLGGLGGVAG